MSGSISITSPDPLSLVLTGTGDITSGISSDFTFSYTPSGANIANVGVSESGDNTAGGYSITFTANELGLSFAGDTGMQAFSVEIPAGFFSAVSTEFVQYTVFLCEIGPGDADGTAMETIDLFIAGTAPPPPPPSKLTPEQKAELQYDANTLSQLANALGDLAAATDPLSPAAKLAGSLAGQLTSAISAQVGQANSAMQSVLGVVQNALEDLSPSPNPIAITLNTAAAIDNNVAKLCKWLAQDPPDGNFTTVYQAPNYTFSDSNIPGASATDITFLNDSWALLQDVSNALVASERYQGAEYAGDTASQALQNTAFNNAIAAYNAQRQVVSTDLNAILTELQHSVSDINLTNDSSTANLLTYLNGLQNPLTSDPFLAGFIASINSTEPNLSAVINSDVQQALTAFETTPAPALTGSAFSAISSAAGQLAAAPLTSGTTTVQQEILGLYAALYNRAADSPGYSYWVSIDGQQSDSGGVTVGNASTNAVTLADAAVLGQQFVNTQNTYFNQTYGSLTDSAFINALYVNLGGNAGDPTGVAYWANLLAQAEAGGESVQAARAGLVGQFVHDLIAINLAPGAAALGLTTDQYNAAVLRQEAIIDKIEVSTAYMNASQQSGGGILVALSTTDAAFQASVAVLQGVTSDPNTVNVATTGINNAVAYHDLTLI